MRILAIETSSRLGGVAVAEDGKLLDERIFRKGMVHGQSLLPTIEETLQAAGWQIAQIDVVAVDEGPGSFTGLRIGVMAAKTICWATGAKLVGVCSADALYMT
ncbi:MAG: tRNA (adenosine(37)-N6)-threonylcarbamoyltransferase complex dimerization subunit type 1 TsaB, partial [Planctomycetota bacterium]